ncbi:endonuclease/exonuclease/phosphatase family protein [Mucilaginibacter sp.]|uniref:endonuclease/exonuclease/phosphatase family protein n=1 Tax=Mucilaginibacter sp. TaxID=1882438 RepID=UPI0035BBE0C6
MKSKIKTGNKLQVIDKIVLVLNIIGAICLLLSYLAPGTDPRDISFIAILGFGYHLLVIANVLAIIYWLFRKRVFALISLIVVIAGAYFFSYNFGFRSSAYPAQNKPANTIRIMAYNVHALKGIEHYEGESIKQGVLDLIKSKQPDVINFEEFVVTVADKGAFTDSLIGLNYKYHYFKPYGIRRADSSGNAIFSKYPLSKFDSVKSPNLLQTRGIYADVLVNGKTFRMYCAHLAAVQIKDQEKSKYLNGGINLEKSSFITSKLSSAFIRRSFQVSQIKKNIDDCPYPYVIVGDFNDTPMSFAVNELGDGLKNAFREKGSGFVNTYYNTFPKLHIDHVLASPQFDVITYEAVDKKLSDHKPIVVDLELN